MSELQAVATAIWTRLLKAMRDDGIVANIIASPGENTLQFVIQMAHENMLHEKITPWVPVKVKPAATAEVFARDFDDPDWPGDIIRYSPIRECWETREGVPMMRQITHYIFLPQIGKVPQKRFV